MTTVLERLPDRARVAVIRLRSLGDCVLTTPALAILKQSRPNFRIAVVIEDRFASVFEGNPSVDEILAPESRVLRAFQAHLALNFHGGTRSAGLTALSGARFRAGFVHFRFPRAYNVRIPKAQEILKLERVVHTAEHLASAIFYLGAENSGIPRASLFAPGEAPIAGSYAVIHPFASQPDKTWPADRFLAIARGLDVTPVFLGGPGDDLSSFAAHRTFANQPLSEVKRLMRHAALFIGNDSGPAHIAAAFGVPMIVLFGSSDPRIWRPWRTAGESLTNPGGIGAISENDVLAALDRLRVTA